MTETENVPAGEESENDLQDRARKLVRHFYNSRVAPQGEHPPVLLKQVYVVWFAKVLGNWKAMLGTVNSDGLYFEVTYDGNKNLAYVDMYEKQDQMVAGKHEDVDAERRARTNG